MFGFQKCFLCVLVHYFFHAESLWLGLRNVTIAYKISFHRLVFNDSDFHYAVAFFFLAFVSFSFSSFFFLKIRFYFSQIDLFKSIFALYIFPQFYSISWHSMCLRCDWAKSKGTNCNWNWNWNCTLVQNSIRLMTTWYW